MRLAYRLRPLALLLLFAVWCGAPAAPAPMPVVAVADELQRLQQQYGFAMRGAELTQDIHAHAGGTDLIARLDLLLEDFDHIIVRGGPHGVRRLIVLGRKSDYAPPAPANSAGAAQQSVETREQTATPPGAIVIQTRRRGDSHLVSAALEGANGQRITQTLLLDTGADRVVVPDALMKPLGLDMASAKTQPVQTANGPIEAFVGKIPALWLGEQRVADVEAAFIDQRLLGANALLGMSVLKRFKVTIDDAGNELVLVPK